MQIKLKAELVSAFYLIYSRLMILICNKYVTILINTKISACFWNTLSFQTVKGPD